jgi:lipopolysaccharide transport system ATP-binding protein
MLKGSMTKREEQAAEQVARGPATFHITHHKAGSQWILAILRRIARAQVVKPQWANGHLDGPLESGKIYGTAYITRAEFEALQLPSDWQRFIVIRDLRDAFVSGYWSVKLSHPRGEQGQLDPLREDLSGMNLHDGLLRLLPTWRAQAEIVRSWLDAPEGVIRYEDLVEDDVGILVPLLTDRLGLAISAEQAQDVVVGARFDAMADGRKRGSEDVRSHYRKGVAGDWRNYIVGEVADAFKEHYGRLLIDAGYERDLDW